MKRLVLASAGLLMTLSAAAQQAPPDPADSPLTIMHVQGNVYMAAGSGPNVTFQVGDFGPVIVDTPPAAQVPQLLAEVAKVNPQRIYFLLHTTAEPEYIAGDVALLSDARVEDMIIPESLLDRMSGTAEENLLPKTTIGQATAQQTTYNSEGIVIYLAPAAITKDGDSFVFFRASDVISVGGLYDPDHYPQIDVARGGTIEGLIDAIYKILDITIPNVLGDGGTLVVPGHGRLAEQTDVAEYRNMLVIVRDRVRDMRDRGMTLQQVLARRPSFDFDTWMNASRSDADRFVESVYRTLPRNTQHGGQHP